ncbi:MAG: GNAT family N-acetyltransferase [Gemmatimonadetes bacterium]|nr:GNAT family N-acetyltransferase [Gemmatimonadota bacterium]
MIRMETDRLVLRSPRPGDLEAVHTAANDQRILRNLLLPKDQTRKLTRDYLRRARLDERRGTGYHFAVLPRGTTEIAGMVSLMERNEQHARAELGYWIAVPHWRKGYGREAVGKVLEYGFRTVKLRKIFATTVLTNDASAGLLQSVGFEHQGLLQKHAKVRGRWWDLNYWELLRETWQESRRRK